MNLAADSLIQFRCVTLNPAPNRNVVDGEAAFCHHLFQIALAQRILQIPPHAENDHDVFEVSTTEQCRPPLHHRITLPELPASRLQQNPFIIAFLRVRGRTANSRGQADDVGTANS